jgi:MFS transporter, SP family, sugar:H+ symporter
MSGAVYILSSAHILAEFVHTTMLKSPNQWLNMHLFQKNKAKATPGSPTAADTTQRNRSALNAPPHEPQGKVPAIAVILGAIASIGGFVFGYESGQISGTTQTGKECSKLTRSIGFLAMSDYIDRFGENGKFSAVRSGTIVGLLS